MKAIARCALLGVVAVLAVGCGESPQVIQYKAGHYQGKEDTQPWESATYGGDKARWESDMRARVTKQSELGRMPH